MHRGQHRLAYLDGLRGVAIGLVVLWHLFGAGDAAYLPYGERFARIAPVRFGWTGVALFFLISGFVIFMTIERCHGWRDFMLRRWVRLFPAMLTASLLLFALDRLLHLPGPDRGMRPIDLLPGLTFVSNSIWHAVLRVPVRSIDQVFWTLYVEAAFYAIFGLLYFRLGWRAAVGGLVALFLATRTLQTAAGLLPGEVALARLAAPLTWLGFQHFAWFASGALFYRAFRDGRRDYGAVALLAGLGAALLYDLPHGVSFSVRLVLCLVPLLFAAAQRLAALRRLLALAPLLFLGEISYPLYLVHDNLGIGLAAAAARLLPGVPPAAWGWLAIAAVMLLATLIARRVERALSPWAARLADRLRRPAAIGS